MIGGGLGNTVVMLACLYFVGKIDFQDPDNLFRLRVAFAAVEAAILGTWALIYLRIKAENDQTPVTQANGDRTTVMGHDLAKLRQFATGTIMSVAISGFIHLKMGVVPPLFIQSVMGPIQTGQNPLVRLYLLGDRSRELVQRPWKEPPNPLASLLGQQQPDAVAAASAAEDGPAEETAPAAPTRPATKAAPKVEELEDVADEKPAAKAAANKKKQSHGKAAPAEAPKSPAKAESPAKTETHAEPKHEARSEAKAEAKAEVKPKVEGKTETANGSPAKKEKGKDKAKAGKAPAAEPDAPAETPAAEPPVESPAPVESDESAAPAPAPEEAPKASPVKRRKPKAEQ